MNDKQKSKRNFRKTERWKSFKAFMKERCGAVDAITLKKLYKTWQLHHRNLDESEYQNLRADWFLPCNNLTHKVLHWLYTYYQKDPQIIYRLRDEMERMKEINSNADKR